MCASLGLDWVVVQVTMATVGILVLIVRVGLTVQSELEPPLPEEPPDPLVPPLPEEPPEEVLPPLPVVPPLPLLDPPLPEELAPPVPVFPPLPTFEPPLPEELLPPLPGDPPLLPLEPPDADAPPLPFEPPDPETPVSPDGMQPQAPSAMIPKMKGPSKTCLMIGDSFRPERCCDPDSAFRSGDCVGEPADVQEVPWPCDGAPDFLGQALSPLTVAAGG